MLVNKDQVKGLVKEVEGKAEKGLGKVTGNKDLEQKGKINEGLGKIQGAYGDVKDAIKKGA
jgi:uncharacterized protein YjbJ (UPF0337 family)